MNQVKKCTTYRTNVHNNSNKYAVIAKNKKALL